MVSRQVLRPDCLPFIQQTFFPHRHRLPNPPLHIEQTRPRLLRCRLLARVWDGRINWLRRAQGKSRKIRLQDWTARFAEVVDSRRASSKVKIRKATLGVSIMAFDPVLAQRVREVLADRPGITERRMFGGLAFLVDGKMFIGIRESSVMARIGPERHQEALAMPNVRVMDFTGRPMKGYVYVDPPAVAAETDLKAWVLWCADYVAGLPQKHGK